MEVVAADELGSVLTSAVGAELAIDPEDVVMPGTTAVPEAARVVDTVEAMAELED